ncbi:hypothetical protein [Streptomyces lasiicapitis]|uniref:DUF3618 domain-containing protein n=1 Tax=Streptomyces lasiicapitis TaxID=1923961 RepID=A0ABQ2MWI9_9ACTN|nr:hypothetical protein [Streptomyces lasiicapitis]GGO59421.1 hypothetical protein GCM10012286_80980 [Streptomyces lasiicapitis]
MTAPNQDPTLWELLRAMQQMRDDLRADFAELGTRLAEMVTKIQYDADRRTDEIRIKSLEGDVADLGRAAEAEREAARGARRLALIALVAPVVVAILVSVLEL